MKLEYSNNSTKISKTFSNIKLPKEEIKNKKQKTKEQSA